MNFLEGLLPRGYLCVGSDNEIYLTNLFEEARIWCDVHNGAAIAAPIVAAAPAFIRHAAETIPTEGASQ